MNYQVHRPIADLIEKENYQEALNLIQSMENNGEFETMGVFGDRNMSAEIYFLRGVCYQGLKQLPQATGCFMRALARYRHLSDQLVDHIKASLIESLDLDNESQDIQQGINFAAWIIQGVTRQFGS